MYLDKADKSHAGAVRELIKYRSHEPYNVVK
jgi:hypothetical protein